MTDCNLCKYDKVKEDYEHCPKCESGSEFVRITNADRIRSMTDEELAELLEDVRTHGFTSLCCNDSLCDSDGCDCCVAEWLARYNMDKMTGQMAIELLNGIIHTSENSDECNNVEIDALHQDALRVAIEAIKERRQYRAIGTVEELQALKEKSDILEYLIKNYTEQIVSLYCKEECADDLENVLSDVGISSEILDKYKV